MADFSVDTKSLDSLGQNLQRYGNDEISRAARYCREYAGSPAGMTGLLSILDEPVRLLSGTFADHYAAMARVVSGTGGGLRSTAAHYLAMDHAARAKFDALAPVVGSQADAAANGSFAAITSSEPYPPTQPGADPSQAARAKMSLDVRAIDWLFHQATGHHITEPIDYLVGNWTALTAQGQAWGHIGDALHSYGGYLIQDTQGIDHVWDGNAARTFKEYGERLGGGFKGEAEICAAIRLVLGELASQFESVFGLVLDILQWVIHQVEQAAIWLAAMWWCGVGEAAASEKVLETLEAFERAEQLVDQVNRLIARVKHALAAFHALEDLWHVVSNIPQEVADAINGVKRVITDVEAIPGIVDDISKLPGEPTLAYGGAYAPGIR